MWLEERGQGAKDYRVFGGKVGPMWEGWGSEKLQLQPEEGEVQLVFGQKCLDENCLRDDGVLKESGGQTDQQ